MFGNGGTHKPSSLCLHAFLNVGLIKISSFLRRRMRETYRSPPFYFGSRFYAFLTGIHTSL